MTLGIRRRQRHEGQRIRRLLDVAQPAADGSGYDHAAIARAMSMLEHQALAELAGEMVPSYPFVAQRLVQAGLAVAGDPPRLSMLGEAVIEALAGLLDV